MVQKLKVTKESLVKDILSWKCDENGIANRDKMAASVAAWGMYILSNKYNNDIPIQINDDPNIGHKSASYTKANHNINVSGKKFTEKDEIGEDLLSILHEVKHYADSTGRISDGKTLTGCIDPDDKYFNEFMTDMYVKYPRPRKLSVKEHFLGRKDMTPQEFSTKFKHYQMARYWLQPNEVAARKFSYVALKELIDTAYKMDNLTEAEQENLSILRKTYDSTLDTEGSLEWMYNRDVEKLDEDAKYLFAKVQEIAFEPNELGINKLEQIVQSDDISEFDDIMEENNDILLNGIKSLEYQYNEEYAKKYFGLLLDANNEQVNGVCMRMARRMINYLPFKPTDEQKEKLENKIDSYNGYLSSRLKYEGILPKESFLIDVDNILE